MIKDQDSAVEGTGLTSCYFEHCPLLWTNGVEWLRVNIPCTELVFQLFAGAQEEIGNVVPSVECQVFGYFASFLKQVAEFWCDSIDMLDAPFLAVELEDLVEERCLICGLRFRFKFERCSSGQQCEEMTYGVDLSI